MPTTQASIKKFFDSPAYAVIGASADKRKFGNVVFRTMKEKGFTVYPVNPSHKEIEGTPCVASVADLPDTVKSVVTVVPPPVTEQCIADCKAKGIEAVWMQPGSESKRAINDAEKEGLAVISPDCILMFIEPVESFHALHRFITKLLGKYPK
jgi:uncharacterized protein